jgi:hypothetical protein
MSAMLSSYHHDIEYTFLFFFFFPVDVSLSCINYVYLGYAMPFPSFLIKFLYVLTIYYNVKMVF